MASEGVKLIGYCPTCEAKGEANKTGGKRRLMLRNGRPFCLACGYV